MESDAQLQPGRVRLVGRVLLIVGLAATSPMVASTVVSDVKQ